MKGTWITGYVALLLVTAAIAACAQAPVTVHDSDTVTAVIRYRSYGGFVMQTHAVQELVVTRDRAVLTISAADGTITEKFEKALTREQYDGIVRVFAENNFESYGDRYDEGQNYVTDVGFTDITFTAGTRTKTVTTDNFNTYLPAGLVRIREKLQETVEFTRTLSDSQIQGLAEDWITGAPTYSYDGSGLGLVSHVRQESYPVRHVLTYYFTSSHAGYGNRSGMATAPVVTEHMIRVTVTDGIVESAVIDDRWDETGQFLQGTEMTLSYQPVKCEKTPWQVWEENSGRVYIRMPSDQEIIAHYYASVYDTEVRGVEKLYLHMASCEACGVCPETYRFELNVNADAMRPLLDEGWTRD